MRATTSNASILSSAKLKKESKDKTGLRSDVVTLYQGAAYHLYRYKRYDDVRLVFAPEQQTAQSSADSGVAGGGVEGVVPSSALSDRWIRVWPLPPCRKVSFT